MITVVQNIFREIQPDGFSLSLARRHVATNATRFNGELVTSMMQEVEVKEGSTFQVENQKLFKRHGNHWICFQQLKNSTDYEYNLVDEDSDKSIKVHIRSSGRDQMILITADGYGEMTAIDGGGCPILIEYHNNEFRLMVWSDINNEEPTHVISLEGAREDARKPDES